MIPYFLSPADSADGRRKKQYIKICVNLRNLRDKNTIQKNQNMKLQIGKYQHYKGKQYEVIGIARHSETLEELVVYKALYKPEGENLWVRPLKMFLENVNFEGKEIPRFKFLCK